MSVSEVVKKRLLELREKKSWTQAEVAKRLNISQRTYSHYENGSRHLSVEMLVAIANLYDVTVDFMISDPENRGTVKADDKP